MSRNVQLQIALLMCLLLCGCAPYHADTDGIQKEIAGAMPLNSSPAQVTAFLDGLKIAHSRYQDDKSLGNTIEAVIEVKMPHAWANSSYNLVFHFNDQNRLEGYEVSYLGCLCL